MAVSTNDDDGNKLQEAILKYGELAFNPERPVEDRVAAEERFHDLIQRTQTPVLLPILNGLIRLSDRIPSYLTTQLSAVLGTLALRENGVQDVVEFVFSVHPTTSRMMGSNVSGVGDSRRPKITSEALASASQLISTPPKGYPAGAWFSGIAPQLFSLLDGQGGLEMVKVASFIIGNGILGRRAFGAPGTAGWRVFAGRMLRCIDPTKGGPVEEAQVAKDNDLATTIKPRDIVVTDLQLSEALRRLVSLLSSHPNPTLSKRLLDRLILPLWSLASFEGVAGEYVEEHYRAPARFLLQIVLRLSSNGAQLSLIEQNLMYQGNNDARYLCWIHRRSASGGIQVERVASRIGDISNAPHIDLVLIDNKINAFIDLITLTSDNDNLPLLFLSLCKEWFLANDNTKTHSRIRVIDNGGDLDNKLERQIIVAKLVQKLIEALPQRLVNDTDQVLVLVDGVLERALKSDEDLNDDDTVAVALSLLNIVLMSRNFDKPSADNLLETKIKLSLETIAAKANSDITLTARNMLGLLHFKSTEPSLSDSPAALQNTDIEDIKTYNVATDYLAAADAPPVRAQGLDLISGLVARKSPVLDIPATIILLSSALQDEEEYIYLRSIKVFVLLSGTHPKTVILSLLERYMDIGEDNTLDPRLRLGEALLQTIQTAKEVFSGDLAREVGSGLLAVAGRRGFRAKQKAEQEKREDLAERQRQAANEAWDGNAPSLDDEEEEDQMFRQILNGWESNMGAEDVRIRASALSIIASAIETNITGFDATLLGATIDLSVNILGLEPQPEKAILRRAATLMIMSMIRAMDTARQDGIRLPFSLAGEDFPQVKTILQYVADTDNDGLVRQHAKDVIEGLATWRMNVLQQPEVQTKLPGLSGLPPLDSSALDGRPKIEEIE